MESLSPVLEQELRPCPVCAETIRASALKCRFCGEDLTTFAARRSEAEEQDLFTGRPALLCSFGHYLLAVVTLGLALPYFWSKRASLHYRITTQRIQIERGLLSRSRSNVELFRIDDYELRKPLGMRLVGQAELRLRSSDRDLADLVIRGLPDLETLAERLRECGLRERERRGVKVWANA